MDGLSVFTETDNNFCVDITSTKDGKFITINSNSRTSSEEATNLFHLKFFLNNRIKLLVFVLVVLFLLISKG